MRSGKRALDRESDGKLVVATHGTGVYSTKINSIYDVFPIWSYDCIDGSCEEKVDGTGFYKLLSECMDSCIVPITKNSIYPNPATNFCIVEWQESENFKTLVMSDVQGKLVQSWKVEEINQLRIETNKLSKGIYLISLVGDNKTVTNKLVVE